MNQTITEQELQKFQDIVSKERLESYKFDANDNMNLVYSRYIYNVIISETFYPILSALEIILRNNLHNAISKIIGKDWLLNELKGKNLLSDNERKLVIEANKRLFSQS